MPNYIEYNKYNIRNIIVEAKKPFVCSIWYEYYEYIHNKIKDLGSIMIQKNFFY